LASQTCSNVSANEESNKHVQLPHLTNIIYNIIKAKKVFKPHLLLSLDWLNTSQTKLPQKLISFKKKSTYLLLLKWRSYAIKI